MSDLLPTAERPTADQLTNAESVANSRRRGQALAGALAGVAVIAVLVAVYVGIQVSGHDKTAAAPPAAAPAAQPSAAAPSEPAAQQPAQPQPVDTPAGLSKRPEVTPGGTKRLTKLTVTSLVKGQGAKVKTGQVVIANYVLATFASGKVIQATWDNGQPAQLPVGQLIPGFDQGIVGVPVGSRVQLDIPAKLAYGDNPTGGAPGGDLRFVVDVLAVQ
jgi:peptidylprolyl isomerase